MAKVLVVDDDQDIAKGVMVRLSAERHFVDVVLDGERALDMLREFSYDAIVLDLGLPGISGIEVLKRYRHSGGQAAVLFLTASGQLANKVQAFRAGCDDYLTKPFDFEEMAARVRVLLRRLEYSSNKDAVLESKSGTIKIDPVKHQAKISDIDVSFDPKEFRIIYVLLKAGENPVPSEKLISDIWGRLDKNLMPALRICIHRLRKILSTNGSTEEIVFVSGSGYVLKVR